MLFALILALHIIVSALLIAVVLMQAGRGGGLAGAFGGGGGNQTLFGGRGATTFLTKATWILGGSFMVTSLVLALAIGSRRAEREQRSLLRDNPVGSPASTGAPQVPGGIPSEGGVMPESPAPGTQSPGTQTPGTQAPGAQAPAGESQPGSPQSPTGGQ